MFQHKYKKYRKLEDSDLIDLLRFKEDSIVFSVIYERYAHLVFGVGLKYLKDEFEAEEMCSTLFEVLQSKIVKHDISNFKSWLYQVAKNECFMLIRKKKYYFLSTDNLAIENEEQEDYKQKEQEIKLLEKAISELNRDQANCIKLFYIDEKSYNEISTELSMDLKKVKSYIQNGKRNLKNILNQHEEFRTV
jgi:RNA polymerase sigma-70 factor (ECF subfamily)